VEFEDLCDRLKQLQSESSSDRGFWAASDEEFDFRNFVYVAGEYGEDGRGRLLVFAFIKGIDDDQGGDTGCFERANDNLFELRTEGFSPNIRIGLQDLEQLLSKLRVLIGELEGKCWEDGLKVVLVLKGSRTKEARAELSIRKARFGKGLCNRGFPGSSQSVEPEDTSVVLVH